MTVLQKIIERHLDLISSYENKRNEWKVGSHNYEAYDFHVRELRKDILFFTSLIPSNIDPETYITKLKKK